MVHQCRHLICVVTGRPPAILRQRHCFFSVQGYRALPPLNTCLHSASRYGRYPWERLRYRGSTCCGSGWCRNCTAGRHPAERTHCRGSTWSGTCLNTNCIAGQLLSERPRHMSSTLIGGQPHDDRRQYGCETEPFVTHQDHRSMLMVFRRSLLPTPREAPVSQWMIAVAAWRNPQKGLRIVGH